LVLSAAALLDPQSLSNPAGGFWRGVLNKLELARDETDNFRLREPVAFEWSPESMAMELLCLEESAGAATCLKADYRQNDRWSLVADVNAISLDYLRNFLEMDVRFEQQVDGRLELQQVSDQAVSGTGNFTLTAGQVIDIESNDVLTRTSDGRFGFLLRDGNLESGVLDLGFSGDSFIDVDFDVLDIMPDGRRALHGRALIHLGNIDVIGHQAIPAVDKFGGSFDSNIQLGGTLDDPTLSGSFSLRNGLVHHVPLGMKLEEVEIEGRLEQRGRGSLKGKFKAGEGVGSIEGSLEFEDFVGLGMDISLAGEQLLLVDTGNLRVLTNTDLDFSLAPGRLDINGRVAVPSARVTPGELVLDRVEDSEDLLIETSEPEALASDQGTNDANRVFGQLEVTFGDDVLVQVPGIKTHISGSVTYHWSGEPVPLARGHYGLKGTVDIYGPTLNIDNGRISFPDVPADNPVLNIRAQREIFGNTAVRSAGVQVIGNLKKPVVEAYTVPLTNEDRAWALLVTGSDFDQSQGVGGFDVGTYIAPRLYVSYGISLFDDENVISARYDLKKGFGIKVTSGEKESGVDISYTIDK
jgi:translocation and assembly module TamB